MTFPLRKPFFFTAVVAILIGGYLLINRLAYINQPLKNLDEKNYPSDHYFLQRTYPDFTFDFVSFFNTLKSEAKKQEVYRGSNAGFSSNWLQEGPGNIGGRFNCIAADPNNPNVIYGGSAAGGVFKTSNGGISWEAIFDGHSYLSIGCITLDPKDPTIVYVGTGDPNIGGYPSIGNGLFRSTDGGLSWENLGLENERIISKIIIDHSNSSIIYAATMGLPFERNSARGLYKSFNGGQSWTQVLYLSDDAGVIDLVMDPNDSKTLFATGWNRIRNNQESVISGSAAKVYKTTDGGVNWVALAGGLPSSAMSRIGLCISKTSSSILYAVYVDPATLDIQGIYKTVNAGNSWIALPLNGLPDNVFGGFGWYFGQIRVHPTNDNELFVLGVDLYKSIDGGNSWSMAGPPWYTYEVHADKHDLIFLNSSTLLLATDGGLYKSTDGGNNFTDIENIPNTQFYRVAYNPHEPDYYYGGAQDNGTSGGNSSFLSNWSKMYGGDGFQPLFDKGNPLVHYCETQNGNIVYTDDGGNWYDDATNGIQSDDRRSWDMPVIMSSTSSKRLLTGTYRVYRNNDAPYGNWSPISNDLTDGIIFGSRYHVISAIEESPLNKAHLFAGTSDGNVWSSANDGANWTNRNGGLPKRYVTSIKASPSKLNTVFVCQSGYKSNEYLPHLHRSDNNGNSWLDVSGDLPQLAVNDVFVLPDHNDSILFVATDGGVYGSINAGISWNRVGANMPVIPVYDIEYNPSNRRLIAGTFARSIMSFPLDSIVQKTEPSAIDLSQNKGKSHSFIYPSPAKEKIVLSLSEDLKTGGMIEIYSINGEKVKVLQAKQHQFEINTEDLLSGAYILQYATENKRVSMRFLKVN